MAPHGGSVRIRCTDWSLTSCQDRRKSPRIRVCSWKVAFTTILRPASIPPGSGGAFVGCVHLLGSQPDRGGEIISGTSDSRDRPSGTVSTPSQRACQAWKERCGEKWLPPWSSSMVYCRSRATNARSRLIVEESNRTLLTLRFSLGQFTSLSRAQGARGGP